MRKNKDFVEGTKDELDALIKKEGVIVSEPLTSTDIVEEIENENIVDVPDIEEQAEDELANKVIPEEVKINFGESSEPLSSVETEVTGRAAIDEFEDKITADIVDRLNRQNKGSFKQMESDINKMKESFEPKHQSNGKPPLRRTTELIRRDYLFKELPMFRFEWIFYVVPTLIAFILISILLVFQSFQMEVGIFAYGPIFSTVLFFIVVWSVYLIKILRYMPIGKKKLVLRFLSNSLVYFSAETIPDSKIHFDKEDVIAPAFVTRENCHFDLSSGAPMIVVCEGEMENLHINSLVSGEKREKSASEFNSVVKQVFLAGWQAAAAQLLQTKDKLKQYSTWLLIGTLLASVITVILLAQVYMGVNAIQETVTAIQAALLTAKGAVQSAVGPVISTGP